MTESPLDVLDASDTRVRVHRVLRAYRETPWYWLVADLLLSVVGLVVDALFRVTVVAAGAFVALYLMAGVAHAAPGGYTFCAAEHNTCVVPSSGQVIYGADSATDATIPSAMYGTPMSTNDTGLSFTCYGSSPGFAGDPAPGYAKACWYLLDTGPASSPTAGTGGGNIDWSNTAHLAQAGMVVALCFAFWMGYRSGDKT